MEILKLPILREIKRKYLTLRSWSSSKNEYMFTEDAVDQIAREYAEDRINHSFSFLKATIEGNKKNLEGKGSDYLEGASDAYNAIIERIEFYKKTSERLNNPKKETPHR